MVRKINLALLRNRNILKNILESNLSGIVPKSDLFEIGFEFSYFTNCTTQENGERTIFCYDYGYQIDAKTIVQIFQS